MSRLAAPFWLIPLGLVLLAALGIALLDDIEALWRQAVLAALAVQRDLHRELTEAIRAVRESEPLASWTLIGLGFLYGVFHAVGPGHGKVVIAAYVATHESRALRAIALSLVSALLQGLVAVMLVIGLNTLLERSMREVPEIALGMEAFSYALVALVGLFLIVHAVRRLLRPGTARAHHHHDCNGHAPIEPVIDASGRTFFLTALSIGVRPCSGAILVMVLALTMQLAWAGAATVAAISLGTGGAVSLLALLSVYARRSALRLSAVMSGDGRTSARFADAAALVGGLVIMAAGLALFEAALATGRHPLL